MNIDHMIKMANEISYFFAAEAKPGDAPREVATHLRRYWDPRMRRQIIAHYQAGAAGLEDIARDAVGILAREAAAGAAAAAAGGVAAAGGAAAAVPRAGAPKP